MYAKYYELRCMFYKKNCTRQSWRVCLIQCQNSVIFGVRFERQKVDKKKQAYTKTETCKLYSRVFIIIINLFAK